MAETSTGRWQPIEEIAAAVRDAGAMLILDTVTALGGIPVEIDKWQIDAVYSGHAEVPELSAGTRAGVVQRSGRRENSGAQAEGPQLVSRRVADRQLLGRRPRVSSHRADQHDLRAARSAAARARRRARSQLGPASPESRSAQGGSGGDRHRLRDASRPRAAAAQRGADSGRRR